MNPRRRRRGRGALQARGHVPASPSQDAALPARSGDPGPGPAAESRTGGRVYPLDFASPLLRLYAFSVDLSILFLLFMALNLLTKGNFASTDAAPQDIFVFFGYFVLLTGIFGQTPGKFAAGIVVVDGDGRTPGVAAAIPREMAGRFVAVIALGAGLLWILYDPKRQGWHDKMAGTFVVRKANAGVPGVLGRMFRRDGRSRGA